MRREDILSKRTGIIASFVGLLCLLQLIPVRADCHPGDANDYQKSIVVTGFPLLQPEQARWGALADMEVRLPQRIAAELNRRGKSFAFDASHVELKSLGLIGQQYGDQFYRTGLSLEQLDLPDTQFLLTGTIENIGETADRDYAWHRRYLRRAAGLLNTRYNQARQFSLVLELVDRYRGELVWQQRFVRQGNWSRKRGEATGTDSPVFWQTEYGKNVADAVAAAVTELQATLDCQPLLLKVSQARGKEAVIPVFGTRQLHTGTEIQLLKQENARPGLVAGNAQIEQVMANGVGIALKGDLLRDIRAGDFVRLD